MQTSGGQRIGGRNCIANTLDETDISEPRDLYLDSNDPPQNATNATRSQQKILMHVGARLSIACLHIVVNRHRFRRSMPTNATEAAFRHRPLSPLVASLQYRQGLHRSVCSSPSSTAPAPFLNLRARCHISMFFSKLSALSSIHSFVSPLDLSMTEARMLLVLTNDLVRHCTDTSSTVLVTKCGHADARAWKELRRKDNIRVYKERPRSRAMPTTPSLLLLGTVKGNLDDVMYAMVTPTEQAMKIKSNCTHDGVIDRKVLNEIVRPSVDDPFRHVSVNWSLYADSEPHDYVCVEATGVTHTLRGERVGFHLSHSVAFSQLPSFSESHGVERGNRSICSLYRETTAGEVECYVRGFFDFRDGDNELLTNIALHAIANQWLSFSRQIEFAHMKKLVWRLRRDRSDSDGFNNQSQAIRDEICCVCFKSFGFLERKTSCASCVRAVCPRCRVKKLLCTETSDGRIVTEKKVAFCKTCLRESLSSSARVIAHQELQLIEDKALVQSRSELMKLARKRTPSWIATTSSFRVLRM